MPSKLYAKWMYAWETALTTRPHPPSVHLIRRPRRPKLPYPD